MRINSGLHKVDAKIQCNAHSTINQSRNLRIIGKRRRSLPAYARALHDGLAQAVFPDDIAGPVALATP